MENGENVQALHKNLELVRFVSVLILLVHFYCCCLPAFEAWGLTARPVTKIIYTLTKGIKFLSGITLPKLVALVLLVISLIGNKGKKDEKVTLAPQLYYLGTGLLLYLFSNLLLRLAMPETTIAVIYMITTSLGYLSILSGGARLSRLLRNNLGKDPFNALQETFPQEERKLTNAYSINLPARYNLKGKTRNSWINLINPFRGLLALGTPGSGKTFFVIRHVITQHIEKGFTCFIYDFKFPDLTTIAYNTALKNMDKYPVPPKFFIINFDDLSRSHRFNVLSPATMVDITDATESSRSIMFGLNREWAKKVGDFFVESPINFTTALFWFLKKYEAGKYCTLPHAIELSMVEYEKLFPVLSLEAEVEVLLNPFQSALARGAAEQLEGQIASAKIGMARLASPSLYYILSGDDFTLDINNPDAPKIVCIGNNPSKVQVYGAVISLCTERMLKLVNQKGKLKSSLIFDEYPTIYADLGPHIATARSNLSATTLAIQDFSQLKQYYGRDRAEVIMNLCGNIVSGQVLGDTAKQLSDRLGKIMQDRESLSINSNDTSISRSTQLEAALQPARISSLSSGEFIGAVSDNPEQRIELKAFHCEIINDFEKIHKEEAAYQPLPVIRHITEDEIMRNYYQIKKDVKRIIDTEMTRIMQSPEVAALLAAKNATQ